LLRAKKSSLFGTILKPDKEAWTRCDGVLGLKEVERPAALNKVYDLIWYEWMDVLLHIDFTPPWTKPAENRHVALEVADIHSVRAYLEREGAEILEAVPMPDRERFYLLDPFGNYIELIELKNS
jgi:catechol 2,3-dioxygenase-like lactoylglutathione lyase family enzyme